MPRDSWEERRRSEEKEREKEVFIAGQQVSRMGGREEQLIWNEHKGQRVRFCSRPTLQLAPTSHRIALALLCANGQIAKANIRLITLKRRTKLTFSLWHGYQGKGETTLFWLNETKGKELQNETRKRCPWRPSIRFNFSSSSYSASSWRCVKWERVRRPSAVVTDYRM